MEFFQRRVAQVTAIDEEEHAPRPCEHDQSINQVDGGEGLAAAGGHLNEGTGTVLS